MNQLEGLPLPTDVIYQNVCKHLWIRDLGKAQQVCHSWLVFFLSDYAYGHVKAHLLYELPHLVCVFEQFPWKYEARIPTLRPSSAKPRIVNRGNKKQRIQKQWVMPTGGTWYTLKFWITYMTNWKTHHKLMKRKFHVNAQLVMVREWIRSWLLTFVSDEQIREELLDLNIYVKLAPGQRWQANFGRENLKVCGRVASHGAKISICIWDETFYYGRASEQAYYPFQAVLSGVRLRDIFIPKDLDFTVMQTKLKELL